MAKKKQRRFYSIGSTLRTGLAVGTGFTAAIMAKNDFKGDAIQPLDNGIYRPSASPENELGPLYTPALDIDNCEEDSLLNPLDLSIAQLRDIKRSRSLGNIPPPVRPPLNLDPLFEQFSPDLSKPVVIFLPGPADKIDNIWLEPFESGLVNAIDKAWNNAAQQNLYTSLKQHYGNNLLVLPYATKELLAVAAPHIQCKLGGASQLQIIIDSHHNRYTDETGNLYGIYHLGERISDKEMANFVKELFIPPSKLTIVHQACDVDPAAFLPYGTNIFMGPKGTLAGIGPDETAQLKGVTQSLVPLLASGASPRELEKALADNLIADLQFAGNHVARFMTKYGHKGFEVKADTKIQRPQLTTPSGISR